ncbi:Nuclear Hormone Receptor family [Aphelenchoides fujianensis]|nr:Nuclear Hormone Receptor family [Aphelenchoides fujianensis]
MDRQAVQGRRDAIGKYSSIFKRESASCNGACVDDCTCAKSKLKAQASALIESPESPRSESSLLTGQAVDETSGAPTSPSTPAVTYPLGSVLAELLAGYKELNRLRKIFYCRKSLQCLFDDSQELKPSELTDFNDAMFQLWRVEPRLSVNFIASISYLRSLPDIEKTRMFSNFLLNFHAIEEPYLTWKFGGLTGDQKFWMMPNRVYLCFDKAEQYFDTPNIMRGLKLDKTSAINLFKPSFQHAMETVGEKMALMDLREVEVVGLIGVVLFDPTCRNLRPETALLLNRLRNQLFSDLLDYYRTEQFEEPEVRLGNLIILLQGVKIHAIKSKENMELLRIFEIAPLDNLFEEIVGISTPP